MCYLLVLLTIIAIFFVVLYRPWVPLVSSVLMSLLLLIFVGQLCGSPFSSLRFIFGTLFRSTRLLRRVLVSWRCACLSTFSLTRARIVLSLRGIVRAGSSLALFSHLLRLLRFHLGIYWDSIRYFLKFHTPVKQSCRFNRNDFHTIWCPI